MQPETAASTTQRKPAHDPVEEAQFRARMAQYTDGAGGRASHRSTGTRAKTGGGFRLGWKSRLALNCGVVLLTVFVVIAWPPFRACRHQQNTIGFYAGDSEDKCRRRGISQRFDLADQRIKGLIRNSGH